MATFVNLTKQTTLGTGAVATPLTSFPLTAPVPTFLSDLRTKLTAAGILANSTQQFLNSGFPIQPSAETQISWLDITSNGVNPLGLYFPPATTTPTVTEPLAQPTLPDAHNFTPATPVPEIAIPAAATIGTAPAHTGDTTNARTMSEEQLAQVFDINSLFSGYDLCGGDDAGFCDNIFLPLEQLHQMYKPLVHVDDGAKVDTITTFSASSAQLARQGFDSASLGLATPWAAGSFAASSSRGTGVLTKGSHAFITGVYRFSRALVQFRDHDLQPTPEFMASIKTALSAPTDDAKRDQVRKVFSQYGHAFAYTVELGGLLHTTSETTISSETDQEQKEKEIRSALSATVTTGSVALLTGNAGLDHANSNSNSAANAKNKDALLFEATGGDTLLASDPSNWTKTVYDYRNWRVCRLSNMKLLTDIPGLFSTAQLAELKRLEPPVPMQQMKSTGPVKPIQGKWVQPHAVGSESGLGSRSHFTVYAPSKDDLLVDKIAGGWYYLGPTTSATSALLVRQNPAWRPIVDLESTKGPVSPPMTPPSNLSYSSTSNSASNPLSTPSLYNFSNEDAPFCPVAKYDRIWNASSAFDSQGKSKGHMFSIWEAFPQDPERFVPLSSVFSAHAPVDKPPMFDERAVCLNKKYLVKAALGKQIWSEEGAFVTHSASIYPIVPALGAIAADSSDSSLAPGQGVSVGSWKGIHSRKVEDFEGEVWLLNEDFIEFVR